MTKEERENNHENIDKVFNKTYDAAYNQAIDDAIRVVDMKRINYLTGPVLTLTEKLAFEFMFKKLISKLYHLKK